MVCGMRRKSKREGERKRREGRKENEEEEKKIDGRKEREGEKEIKKKRWKRREG